MSRTRLLAMAAIVLLAGAAALIPLGVTARDAALLTTVVAVQAVAGGYLWRVTTGSRREAGTVDPVEILGWGLAGGTAAAAASGALISLIVPTSLGWLLPSAIAAAVWVARRSGGRHLEAAVWRLRGVTAGPFLLAVGLGVFSIVINLARYPLGGAGPWTTYHPDMLYFEGLATSTARFGGADSIFMAGGDIRYHWFAYGWVGQVADAAGAAPFATLTRVLPVVALLGCAALVISWTARIVNRWPATVLAVLLLTTGGYLGATNGTILNFDSPSQNLTTLWLVGGLLAALAYVRGQGGSGLLAIVVALSAAVAGGKISSAAVLIIPLVLVALIASIRNEDWRQRAWLVVLLAIVAAGVVYVLFVSGSASGGDLRFLSLDARASSVMGLDSSKGLRGVVLGTAALMLAMAARWWGLGWLVRDRETRWHLDTVAGIGLVLASFVPLVLLSQGLNETWFALAASAPLAALSAAGIARAWSSVRKRGALIASLGVALLVVLLVPVVWVPDVVYTTSIRFFGPWIGYGLAVVGAVLISLFLGRQSRRDAAVASFITILVIAGALARISPEISNRIHPSVSAAEVSTEAATPGNVPVPQEELTSTNEIPLSAANPGTSMEPPPMTSSWTADEVAAAEYVRANVDRNAIIVTNDTRGFVVPALTQRRTFMSGSTYQELYGSSESVAGIPQRVENSQAFLAGGDAKAFRALCSAGVTWGWVRLGGEAARSWEPNAETVFENSSVAIIRLNEEKCA